MPVVATDLIQQSESGAHDVPMVVMVNSDGTGYDGSEISVDGRISTDLIQQPATGGARDVQVVIAVNADGSPISTGGGGGGDALPTGTTNQVMGFGQDGKPIARTFLAQMWGELLVGFPAEDAWIPILLNDGTHAFVPASLNNMPSRIPVRNTRGALTSVDGEADDELVTVGQLFDLINRVSALENVNP